MTGFSLNGIVKKYAGRTVLDIDRLEIEPGRIHALLGPNGAGKTTLLEILAFLEPPTAGVLRYRSRPVYFIEEALQPLRREVLLVSQSPVMFSTSVYGNVEFGLRIRKVSRAERERRVADALALVGMSGFASGPAHRLSGGETQRVSLARALALSPRVLLCDEPTANVDVENRAVILGLLRRINRESGVTVVLTTHDRHRVEGLAHRIFTLSRGRLVEREDENIFTARVAKDRGDLTELVLHGSVLVLARRSEATALEGQVRVAIDSCRIHLEAGPSETLENPIAGRVCEVAEGNGGVRVTVDAGPRFTVAMPIPAYREKGLLVGDNVCLAIPPEAVRILS